MHLNFFNFLMNHGVQVVGNLEEEKNACTVLSSHTVFTASPPDPSGRKGSQVSPRTFQTFRNYSPNLLLGANSPFPLWSQGRQITAPPPPPPPPGLWCLSHSAHPFLHTLGCAAPSYNFLQVTCKRNSSGSPGPDPKFSGYISKPRARSCEPSQRISKP